MVPPVPGALPNPMPALAFSFAAYEDRATHERRREPRPGHSRAAGPSGTADPEAVRTTTPRPASDPMTVVLHEDGAAAAAAATTDRIWLDPHRPMELTVVSVAGPTLLRDQLGALLDHAGRRRDVRVSVGVAVGAGVTWVLDSVVPYDVRAMPRHPDPARPADPVGALEHVLARLGTPVSGANRVLVVIWPAAPLSCLAPVDLVVHCVPVGGAELPDPAGAGRVVPQVVLVAGRPGARVLSHCGTLLDGWRAFERTPPGVRLLRS